MELYGGAEIHLQPMEDPHQSRWIPEEICDAMESSH